MSEGKVDPFEPLAQAYVLLLGFGERQTADRVGGAIDAVRELVEAARRANGEHAAPHDCYATGPLTGDTCLDLVGCPGCALAKALAKFPTADSEVENGR